MLGAGAMIEATRAFFRTDRVTWTVTTVGVAGLTQPSRTYTSLSALGADIGRGRVLAGLHFQFSVDAGRAQAREIVNHIKANFFHRRR